MSQVQILPNKVKNCDFGLNNSHSFTGNSKYCLNCWVAVKCHLNQLTNFLLKNILFGRRCVILLKTAWVCKMWMLVEIRVTEDEREDLYHSLVVHVDIIL